MKEFVALGAGMVLAVASILVLESIEAKRSKGWEKRDY